MLSNTLKRKINSKLKNIYSKNFKNKDLKIFSDEILNSGKTLRLNENSPARGYLKDFIKFI